MLLIGLKFCCVGRVCKQYICQGKSEWGGGGEREGLACHKCLATPYYGHSRSSYILHIIDSTHVMM